MADNARQLHLPPACVTGIGSLPFTDAAAAVAFVERWCPELPFWPQLPKRGMFETIVPQFMGPALVEHISSRQSGQFEVKPARLEPFLRELESAAGELGPLSAAGFQAFEQALSEGRFAGAMALKGQIEGPLTLAASLLVQGKPVLFNREVLEAITRFLVRGAQWQIDRLRAASRRPLVVFVDEPVLTIISRPRFAPHREVLLASVQTLLRAIRHAGAAAGVHCCAERPLELLAALDADVYSFDAYSQLELLFDSPAGRQLLERNRTLALGLIPVVEEASDYPDEFVGPVAEYVNRAAGEARAKLLARALITTACGFGLSSETAAHKAFDCCRQLSAVLRDSKQN